MKISLVVPQVNFRPTTRPRACPRCKEPILHRHGTVKKPIKDHKEAGEVEVHRYKCASCGRTFRHYPSGVTSKDQTQRTVVLAALMYALGLSCSASSHLLGVLGARVGKTSVWRDAQEAAGALRKSRPAGRVRVASLGVDETVFKVKGKEVVVGFVVDAKSGKTLGFEVLFEGDGEAFSRWLSPYVEEFGVEVLVSDDNDSYGVATSELGLAHQLCIAHVRKYVSRRATSILEQASTEEWGEQEDEKIGKLSEDLESLKRLLKELPEEGGKRIGRLHRGYLCGPPHPRGRGKRRSEPRRLTG